MTLSIVPTATDEQYYSEEVILDGTPYELTFRWNARASLWYMDIRLLNGTPVQLGVPVTTRAFLTRQTRISIAPQGELWAVEQDGNAQDAQEFDLGDRVVLFYIPVADIITLATGTL